MNRKELEAFAREAAKGIKTEKDLSDFSQMLTKITVETAPGCRTGRSLGVRQASAFLNEQPSQWLFQQDPDDRGRFVRD